MKLNIKNIAKAGIKKNDLCNFLAKWGHLFNQEHLAKISKQQGLEF